MKHFAAALIYIGFFALIGFAVFYVKSAWPLWALLLTPSVESTTEST